MNIDHRPNHLLSCFVMLLLMMHACCRLHAQRVYINELMQSNVDCLMVEQDFPDAWVELYNDGETEASLAGWTIGKDSAETYILGSEAIVPAKGFLLIYCDKQGKGLHTSFRLDADKGKVELYDKNGVLQDRIQHPKMPAPNIAYGQYEEKDGEWGYELHPTPGTSNGGGLSDELPPAPVFSVEGGLMDAPFQLQIDMPHEGLPRGAELYWTLDGSEPDTSSAHATSTQLTIDSSTVVRAKILAPDALCPRATTQSYIFHPRTTDIPIVSLATDAAYLFDDAIGILYGAKDDAEANYWHDWRRPINVEYLAWDTDSSDVTINQLAETAVGGATSRVWAQKSLKVYAHKRFGRKHLKGHLWHDKDDVGQCKSLMLRNGGSRNDGGMLHDAFVQRLFGTHIADLDWQAYEPVICYINGTYRGIYELRERSNEDYVEANYHRDDIVQNESLYRGDEQWIELREMAESGAPFADIAQRLDVDEFVSCLMAEVFTANTDWPANNVSLWKPDAPDGRWRCILKDLDQLSYYATPKNFLNYVFLQGDEAEREWTGSKYLHHGLLCALNGYDEFRSRLINRAAVSLGDFLKPTVSLPMFEAMASRIEPELAATKEAWGGRPVLSWVHHEWDSIRSYLRIRPLDLYGEFDTFYQLGGLVALTIATSGRDVDVCGIALTEGDFDGQWFGAWPIEVQAGDGGLQWRIVVERSDQTVDEYTAVGPTLSFTPQDYGRDVARIHLDLFDPVALSPIHHHPTPERTIDLMGRPSDDAAHRLRIEGDRVVFR